MSINSSFFESNFTAAMLFAKVYPIPECRVLFNVSMIQQGTKVYISCNLVIMPDIEEVFTNVIML